MSSTYEHKMAHLAVAEGVRAVYLHDLAVTEIQAMYDRVEQIKKVFGEHDEYHKAASSLNWCLRKLFMTGFAPECYVTRDGELSLYVQEGGVFVFGLIWFRDRYWDNVKTDDPRYRLAGEWSSHS